MIYKVFFGNAGVPALLLTPAWNALKKVSDGEDVADPPAISEVGGGWYKFDLSPAEDLVGVIDGGAGLGNTDRYQPVYFTATDGALDDSISSVKTDVGGVTAIVGHQTYGNSALKNDLTLIGGYVTEIPTTPLLRDDMRVSYLDAPISSKVDIYDLEVALAYYIGEGNIVGIKAKTDTIAWADITDLKDEALGKWVLDPSAHTLTLYRADGVAVLKTFNLGRTTAVCPAYVSRTPR